MAAQVAITKEVNPGQLRRELAQVIGRDTFGLKVVWDSITRTGYVRVLDDETIANAAFQGAISAHVAQPDPAPPPLPKPVNMEKLVQRLIAKGVLASRGEVEA